MTQEIIYDLFFFSEGQGLPDPGIFCSLDVTSLKRPRNRYLMGDTFSMIIVFSKKNAGT